MSRIKTDGILFDLDGTLWDSSGQVADSWNESLGAFEQVKRTITPEDIQSIMGLRVEEIGPRLFPDLPPSLRDQVMEACIRDENRYLAQHGGTLYPQLIPLLEGLSQYCPLFIVSNCQVGYIEAFLQYHQLGRYFRDFVGAGHTGLSKGENIALMVSRHQLCLPVYLGDTQGDCNAAYYAGVRFLHASYGFGVITDPHGDKPVPEVASLAELPSMLCTSQGVPFTFQI